MDDLRDLIGANETWLTARVLRFARQHGYTADSSTLETPWRASVCGFSEPMRRMLSENRRPPAISSTIPAHPDPITAFSVEEARLHRLRGVPLHQFMGLTKYYRSAYLELIRKAALPTDKAEAYAEFIDLFFDNAEIAICLYWEQQDQADDTRKLAETNKRLTNEKNRYLTIFESLNTPVILIDDKDCIVNRNLAASLLFDTDALPGEGYYAPASGRVPAKRIDEVVRLIAGGADGEAHLETRRGTKTFQVKTQRMLDVSGKFDGSVVILTDITDLRRAQQASENANRAKSAFLATMSHEIRTPINGILGVGHLLRDSSYYEFQKRYVDALLSSGELLLDQVNAILDYSKLESGETNLHPAPFAPRQLVQRIERLCMAELRKRGVNLVTEISDACPGMVVADGEKIQRIVINLVTNAIKFTSKETVSLTVDARDGQLCISVRDYGPGIPKQDRQVIFEPFVQRPAGTGRQPEGTGLGLAISHRLARTLDGDLTLQQPAGGGSLFRLLCPVQPAEDLAETMGPEAEVLRNLDILLVEDNDVNALVIEGFLESDDHRTTTVARGEDALQRLGSAAFDLVLLDVRLRGIDGFETVARMRASPDPNICRLPVLILTADESDTVLHRFALSAANAFQSKPFNRDELRLAIARAMASPSIPDAVAETAAAETPVLDTAVVAGHRMELGDARTARILQTFIEMKDDHIAALRAAAVAGKAAGIADIAHSVKSAADICGLQALSRSATRTERGIPDAATTAELVAAAERLCIEIDRGASALSGYLATRMTLPLR
jgi:signal transduction histidine kinase/DNA-binding response OmpR family regulator